MRPYSLLLSIALSCCCSAAGDLHDNNPPAAMTMGAVQSPDRVSSSSSTKLSELVQNEPEDVWRTKVLDLLTQLVLIQKDMVGHQVQMVQQLGILGSQGSQQIQDLQNLARHQSLLVENHQALLLQTSRISSQLQEVTKKPATGGQ